MLQLGRDAPSIPMKSSDQPNSNHAQPLPRNIAIIADGNGRWAERRGLPIVAGHDAAADTLRARIRDAVELGVQELAVYVFSTENWSRPADEVGQLMGMFSRRIAIETEDLHRLGARVRFLGRREELSEELIAQIERVESLTRSNQTLMLFLGFNYGGRAEIVQAAARFEGSTEEEFRCCLYAPEMSDPEVIIRTGGDQRLSNYLLWQSAYSELVFRDELWPDFTRECFQESLSQFNDRRRRFGGRLDDLATR
jgi:undecaprenyl diphosphate synthase